MSQGVTCLKRLLGEMLPLKGMCTHLFCVCKGLFTIVVIFSASQRATFANYITFYEPLKWNAACLVPPVRWMCVPTGHFLSRSSSYGCWLILYWYCIDTVWSFCVCVGQWCFMPHAGWGLHLPLCACFCAFILCYCVMSYVNSSTCVCTRACCDISTATQELNQQTTGSLIAPSTTTLLTYTNRCRHTFSPALIHCNERKCGADSMVCVCVCVPMHIPVYHRGSENRLINNSEGCVGRSGIWLVYCVKT